LAEVTVISGTCKAESAGSVQAGSATAKDEEARAKKSTRPAASGKELGSWLRDLYADFIVGRAPSRIQQWWRKAIS
jgi:hypothetical protein